MRPVAVGHHRYEWLYVIAFVSPATGESFWYIATTIDKELFEDALALFAREAGAGPDRIIILVLDGAGWHSEPGLAVPEGIRLVYLPPYTPELQPAETLWVHVDEPIVNRHFETPPGGAHRPGNGRQRGASNQDCLGRVPPPVSETPDCDYAASDSLSIWSRRNWAGERWPWRSISQFSL